MPSFVEIGPPVLEKIFEGFLPYMGMLAWWSSWSCDLDFLYMHWFPLPIDASYKIWLWLAKWFQRRSLKMVDDGQTDDVGRTRNACLSYELTCEPSAQVS